SKGEWSATRTASKANGSATQNGIERRMERDAERHRKANGARRRTASEGNGARRERHRKAMECDENGVERRMECDENGIERRLEWDENGIERRLECDENGIGRRLEWEDNGIGKGEWSATRTTSGRRIGARRGRHRRRMERDENGIDKANGARRERQPDGTLLLVPLIAR